MRSRKKKQKKLIRVLFILLFLFISIGGYSLYCKFENKENIFLSLFETTRTKLEKLGYSSDEVDQIYELKDETIHEILNHDYEKNLFLYLTSRDFKEEKLFLYLSEEKKSNLKVEDIIFLVNHNDYDKDAIYTEAMISLLKEQYYLSENKTRYFNYLEKYPNLTSKEIITKVNANRDYEFYTNTKKVTYSLTVLVNKYHYLEKNDTPSDLVTQSTKYGKAGVQLSNTAYQAFKKMYEDARKQNLTLYLNSAYRSYTSQADVFADYQNTMGEKAVLYAAKPGYSEHQTGLALDIFKPGTTTKTFENTKEAKWLSENAHKYGFILRYPKGKEDITGYSYESWHYRYVGIEIATIIKENDLTFEEYAAYYLN